MNFADITLTVTYQRIGDHLLVHMHERKMIDSWMLLDLEELSRKSGRTPDEIVARLCKKKAGD